MKDVFVYATGFALSICLIAIVVGITVVVHDAIGGGILFIILASVLNTLAIGRVLYFFYQWCNEYAPLMYGG